MSKAETYGFYIGSVKKRLSGGAHDFGGGMIYPAPA